MSNKNIGLITSDYPKIGVVATPETSFI